MKKDSYFQAWKTWERERKRKGIKNSEIKQSGNITTISSAIGNWKEDIGAKSLLYEAELIVHWKDIVGIQIAEHSAPIQLQHGRLMIQVKESVWRHQLLFFRAEMIKKINTAFGSGTVKEIVLTG